MENQQTPAKSSAAAELHPVLRFERPDDWSDAEELLAERRWSETKEDWHIPSSLTNRYLQLWKMCLQHGDCTPFDIVGVKRQIEVERDARSSTNSKMFPNTFSIALSRLVTHPIWPRNFPGEFSDSLAAVIQYAVMLRTGHRRVWNPAQGSRSQFLCVFKEMSAAHPGMPMPHVHMFTRSACLERQIEILPISVSGLLLKLERSVQVAASANDDVVAPYKVQTRDLTAIVGAIDQLYGPSSPGSSVDFYFKQATGSREKLEPSIKALPQFHDCALLEECRRFVAIEARSDGLEDATNNTADEPMKTSADETMNTGISAVDSMDNANGESKSDTVDYFMEDLLEEYMGNSVDETMEDAAENLPSCDAEVAGQRSVRRMSTESLGSGAATASLSVRETSPCLQNQVTSSMTRSGSVVLGRDAEVPLRLSHLMPPSWRPPPLPFFNDESSSSRSDSQSVTGLQSETVRSAMELQPATELPVDGWQATQSRPADTNNSVAPQASSTAQYKPCEVDLFPNEHKKGYGYSKIGPRRWRL